MERYHSSTPSEKSPFGDKRAFETGIGQLSKDRYLGTTRCSNRLISSVVVIKKSNGKIRLCIDPKPLNQALKRNHYPLPVIDDLLPLLANAKVFSIVNAKNGRLDSKRTLLTTFNIPWGRFRWTCLPFGISSAPEEFQTILECAL